MELSWAKEMPFSFNAMLLTQLYNPLKSTTSNKLLFGTTDGSVRIFSNNEEEESLETKGSSVCAMIIKESQKGLLRRGSAQERNQLIIADNMGKVIVFALANSQGSQHQILTSFTLSHTITQLVLYPNDTPEFHPKNQQTYNQQTNDISNDNNNNLNDSIQIPSRNITTSSSNDNSGYIIVAGNTIGEIVGLIPLVDQPLWKINMQDDHGIASLKQNHPSGIAGSGNPIRCLIATSFWKLQSMEINNKDRTQVLLVSNSTASIHFYHRNIRIHTLLMPSRVTSILLSNSFGQDSSTTSTTSNNRYALLAGCEDGFIYRVSSNLTIQRFIKIGYPITNMHLFSPKDERKESLLLVCGQFNGVQLYNIQGKLLHYQRTTDWVHLIAVGDVDHDQEEEIVLGMVNNYVQVFKWNATKSNNNIGTTPTPDSNNNTNHSTSIVYPSNENNSITPMIT